MCKPATLFAVNHPHKVTSLWLSLFCRHKTAIAKFGDSLDNAKLIQCNVSERRETRVDTQNYQNICQIVSGL